MHRVYVSTGAFTGRANGRNFRLIPGLAKNLSCDGFELMFDENWYGEERELIGLLQGSGLTFPTLHCDKKIGEYLAEERFDEAFRRFDINCNTAKTLGAGLLVLHLWNGMISDSNIGANFSAYPRLCEIAQEYGVILTVENVLAHGGSPLGLWHKLRETSPDALFTYDTKMAEFDGENALAFVGKNLELWKNVRHLHINDRTGGYRDWTSIRSLNIGAGTVDFEHVFRGLKEVGYAGDFTVEANAFRSDGSLDFEGLQGSVESVRGLRERFLL